MEHIYAKNCKAQPATIASIIAEHGDTFTQQADTKVRCNICEVSLEVAYPRDLNNHLRVETHNRLRKTEPIPGLTLKETLIYNGYMKVHPFMGLSGTDLTCTVCKTIFPYKKIFSSDHLVVQAIKQRISAHAKTKKHHNGVLSATGVDINRQRRMDKCKKVIDKYKDGIFCISTADMVEDPSDADQLYCTLCNVILAPKRISNYFSTVRIHAEGKAHCEKLKKRRPLKRRITRKKEETGENISEAKQTPKQLNDQDLSNVS